MELQKEANKIAQQMSEAMMKSMMGEVTDHSKMVKLGQKLQAVLQAHYAHAYETSHLMWQTVHWWIAARAACLPFRTRKLQI